jgi:hypothetical protein
VISGLVAVAVLALVLALIVIFARDTGPTPADIAVAYELAWDRLDFDALWALSGNELRDGLDKRSYIQAKSAAYAGRADLGYLAAHVEIDAETVGIAHATVRTRVLLLDGKIVHNDLAFAKQSSGWTVTGYQLAPGPSQPV